MLPPKIENSTREERQAYVVEAWKCLHDCEACGKCRILKGLDAETLFADNYVIDPYVILLFLLSLASFFVSFNFHEY